MAKYNDTIFKTKKPPATISITSLMDVMTIILVFLLVNYSSDVQTAEPPANIVLPIVDTTANPALNVIPVIFGKDFIKIKDQTINFNSFQHQKNFILAKAQQILKNTLYKTHAENLVLTIHADKDINYDNIESFLIKAGELGINQIQLIGLKQQE